MSTITWTKVAFHYAEPYKRVFDSVSFSLDCRWKTAVIGRNGRGKTTLLRLIAGELQPTGGRISAPPELAVFPLAEPAGRSGSVRDLIKNTVAPFARWEREMARLLNAADGDSLAQYGEILERYESAGGYTIDARIERECVLMEMPVSILDRSSGCLSAGEQTRVQIIALFLRRSAYPLIDEPTNHLDAGGRQALAAYLRSKQGFLLVSHDRAFLDACTDHVLAVNKSDIRLSAGNYSVWKQQADREEQHELHRHENIRREVRSLEQAAAKRRGWAHEKEKSKRGAYDKGFVGSRAAKQMKRALAVERRIHKQLDEKRGLLANREHTRPMHLQVNRRSADMLLLVDDLTLSVDGRDIVSRFSFSLQRGERLALCGPNGCGKTSVLKTLFGEMSPTAGSVFLAPYTELARAYQVPLWGTGMLDELLRRAQIPETDFRNIMGAFGLESGVFDRPLETLSEGERKKVDLCRSFVNPAHLFVWDEPMNYIDIASREQIEALILRQKPTMLFVEHDRSFVDRIATRVVTMPKRPAAG